MLNNSIKCALFFSLSLIITSECFAHGAAKHSVTKHAAVKQTVTTPKHLNYPVQHWVTQQGADVYFLPTNELPIIDVQVAFAAGSARDGKLSGIATLTNSLLDSGSTTHTADQIAEGFDTLGAQYSNDASRDMAIVRLRSLTDKKLLDQAVNLFAEVLSQPKFPEEDFRRERNNQLAAIKQELQSPSDIAINHFYKSLYGKHPYANPVLGNASILSELSARHAKEFYDTYYTTQNETIAIVGKIERAQAEQIASSLTQHMNIGRKAPKFNDNPPLANSISETVAYPAQQTNIIVGQLGISRDSQDYFPLIVGNYSLGGGGLVSRLFEQVREKRGLSYSAYSQFIPMSGIGPFIISLGTRNNQAQQALSIANEVFRQFIKQGPTKYELAAAKKNINGSFALLLDSNQALAANLLVMGFYNLPTDYLNTYQAKVNAVTQHQVQLAFQHHLDPEKTVTVQVGAEIKPIAHVPAQNEQKT